MSNFRRRLMCKKVESELPSGYTRLNYLESTGTQYIDMCVTPFEIKDMQLIFDYQITDDFTKDSRLFGARISNNLGWCHFFVNTNIKNIGFQWGLPTFNDFFPKDNLRHSVCIDAENKKINFDNATYNINIDAVSVPVKINCYLFCRNSQLIPDYFIYAKIYSFKIQNGDELYRNFVPALDTKNRPCLYDTVSRQPFYNEGTGEFLYG